MLAVTLACSSRGASGTDADTAGGTDADAAGGTGADTAGGTCLPGATKEDCTLCTFGVESCDRACPKVDCTVVPTPAACLPLCGTDSCCACTAEGPEYWWRRPVFPITCQPPQQACDDLRTRWNAIVARADIRQCATSADCVAVSASLSCDGAILIDQGVGTVVNGAAYATTEGPSLERTFGEQRCGGVIFDAAPPIATCTAGVCQAIPRFCNQPRDGGLDI